MVVNDHLDIYEYSPKIESIYYSFSKVVKEKKQVKMNEVISRKNTHEFHHEPNNDIIDSSYCGASQESLCMCSAPENTSTVYNF